MAIADYKGPAANVSVLPYLLGETIKATFFDSTGKLWLVMQSGWGFSCAAFSATASPFSTETPEAVTGAMNQRAAELQAKIAELKLLAPGLNV